jgi:outer membrane protein assembly factor BamD
MGAGVLRVTRTDSNRTPWGQGLSRSLCVLVALLLSATLVSGCGSLFNKKKEAGEVASPDVIYGRADAMLDQQSYEAAAKQYEEVDVNHPYSTEARRAIVMAAYSYYKAGKYDDAVSAADRYLTLHPGTPESDLAQNIIGMSYYVQVLDPKRDQTNARKSLQAYLTLLQRYPESRYAAEAQNRARILRDLLAACHQSLPRRRGRISNHRAGRRGSRPLDRGLYCARHHSRGAKRCCRARL